MGKKIIPVSSELMNVFFTDGELHAAISNGLPADATLIDVRVNHWNGKSGVCTIEFLYASKSFEEVSEGELVPYLTPTYNRVNKDES